MFVAIPLFFFKKQKNCYTTYNATYVVACSHYMFGKKKESDALDRYEDPLSGFSSTDLKRGIWYVEHRDLLKRIFMTCFIFFDIGFLGYGLWGWGSYMIVGYTQDKQNEAQSVAGFQNYAVQQARYEASDVQFGVPEVFQSADDVYDFVIDVDNPNERWVARVRYQFTYSGGMTEEREAILMPGVHQPMVVFGVGAVTRPSSVRFQPLSVEWRSIDPHAVFDIKGYLEKRNQFEVSDVSFTRAADADIGGDRLTFTLSNNSVFRYWTPQFFVELKDGQKRQGIALVTIDQLLEQSVRPVDIRLFGSNLFVTDVTLYLTINFFDQGAFME